MKRYFAILGVLVAAGMLFWRFPLFHVVAQGEAAARQAPQFNAAEFVQTFWTERLVPSLGEAADAASVLAALRDTPDEARQKFGRSAGLGRAVLFIVRGQGAVVTNDASGVGVALREGERAPEVVLQTGVISGNTVRDATGLLSAGDYPSSQQFNEISTELNKIVETSVIPELKSAEVGRRIAFVGCARVVNLPGDARPLKLIPLEVRLE